MNNKNGPFGVFFGGGTSVTVFEPIYLVVDWLFRNNNQALFELSKTTVVEGRQQILDMDYVF